MPDPDADLGAHHFRYALLLHPGEQDLSQVGRAAERSNNPIMLHGPIEYGTTEQRPLAKGFSFVSADTANLTIETVKLAQEGSEAIVRIFEHANRRIIGRIRLSLPFVRLKLTY